LPVDLNQFHVEQLADALQIGAVVAAGVACCEVGDDDCRAAVLGVEVLAREPEMQGCPGADELAVQNRLADGVPAVAADPGAAAVDVDLYLDCPRCRPLCGAGRRGSGSSRRSPIASGTGFPS